MIKLFYFVFIAFLCVVATHLNAQKSLNSEDSLKGFDEVKIKETGLAKHLIDKEFKFFLNRSKREFVNHKYNIGHSHEIVWKTLQTATVQPACSNVDFEDVIDFNGWTIENGGNSNSLTMAGCCNPGVGVASIINSVGNDPLYNSLSLISPFGGNKIAKLNDETANNKSQRISQTFNVTSSNAIFQIAYCGLLNSGGHDCVDQPYINISVKDSTGTDLGCPKIEIQAPDPNCTPTNSASTLGWNYTGFNNPSFDVDAKVFWHDWEIKTVDLSPYIGSNITIQITVGDCSFTAHYGYAYFDCRCLPLEIALNNSITNTNTIYDATPQIPINVSTCGAASALVFAPTGLGPYLWDGPSGSGITAVTTQSMSTNIPGTYTLNMNPSGGCTQGGVIKYVILNVSPNPTITNVTAQATCTNATGSGTINVASGTNPFTYNWLPAAFTGSVGTGLSPGTDYTVNVVDTFGCQGVTIISIASFTDAPTYSINPLSANLSCNSPSLIVTTQTGTNTVAAWTHTSTTNFDVTSAGSYSCVLTNTLSLCSATVPITISTNTVAPVATYSLLCNTTTVSLNAASAGGIALGWLAPTLPGPSPVSNPGISTASGIFTLTATNLSTGCKSTYTIESLVPGISVTTNPSVSNLTCITHSIQAATTSSTTGTTITWFDGVSIFSSNSFSMTSAGSYTTIVALAGGCSTQSIITVNTNTSVGVSITSPSLIPCLTNSLTLTANQLSAGIYSYVWMPAPLTATNSSYNVSTAGLYTVVALNTTNGCTATTTQAVTHETITASFIADPYLGLMPLPVSFTNTSIGNPVNTDYYWDLANGTTYINTLIASTVYESQGDYSVVLTAVNGFCIDTATRIIKVELVSFFKVPNVFTPNGDGANDIFTFDAINMGEITFSVFDRWGLKMFETMGSGNIKWDGKNKSGASVADGNYFYIIKAAGLDDVKHDTQGTLNVFR